MIQLWLKSALGRYLSPAEQGSAWNIQLWDSRDPSEAHREGRPDSG
jgi:hypothetical protein